MTHKSRHYFPLEKSDEATQNHTMKMIAFRGVFSQKILRKFQISQNFCGDYFLNRDVHEFQKGMIWRKVSSLLFKKNLPTLLFSAEIALLVQSDSKQSFCKRSLSLYLLSRTSRWNVEIKLCGQYSITFQRKNNEECSNFQNIEKEVRLLSQSRRPSFIGVEPPFNEIT